MSVVPEPADLGVPCEAPGCTLPGYATETLWLNAPLGLCAVHVHRDRGCAEAARTDRGGGRFIPEPMSPLERETRRKHAGYLTVQWDRVIAAIDARDREALHARIRAALARIARRRSPKSR